MAGSVICSRSAATVATRSRILCAAHGYSQHDAPARMDAVKTEMDVLGTYASTSNLIAFASS